MRGGWKNLIVVPSPLLDHFYLTMDTECVRYASIAWAGLKNPPESSTCQLGSRGHLQGRGYSSLCEDTRG